MTVLNDDIAGMEQLNSSMIRHIAEKHITLSGEYLRIIFNMLYQVKDIALLNEPPSLDEFCADAEQIMQDYFRIVHDREQKVRAFIQNKINDQFPYIKSIRDQLLSGNIRIFEPLISSFERTVSGSDDKGLITVCIGLDTRNVHVQHAGHGTFETKKYLSALYKAYRVVYERLMTAYRKEIRAFISEKDRKSLYEHSSANSLYGGLS